MATNNILMTSKKSEIYNLYKTCVCLRQKRVFNPLHINK